MDAFGTREIDVTRLVDEQRFGLFNLGLLFWSFLALFADGFEISSLGLATPHIIREWHVPAGSLGPMLSASLAGIFIGSPLLGTLGDRYGRRFVIILGCLIFGVTTFGVVFATSIGQIAALRFLTGLGMGGLMPNAIALNSELSAKRLRARLIILMFLGISVGSATPPLVALWGVPHYGWRVIFVVGGIVPLVIAGGLFLFLPESVRFLLARPDRHGELRRVLARLRPDVPIPADATFMMPAQAVQPRGDIRSLFTGGLLPITLLLWLCFATTLMANFFLSSWMPLLLEMKGVNARDAALIVSFYHIGGAIGGVAMALLLDRFGLAAVAVLLVLAAPAVVAFGLPNVPALWLGMMVGFAGFSVLGAQFGGNAAAGLIYPTACRALGVGVALAVARVGSVLGPIIGARMIGMHLPIISLLLALAGPMLLGGLAALVLAAITQRRFGGWGMVEA